ncbi:NAD(P)/FAD-dependent oxidoreductase [Microtetraspora sp. NBRC 16547]|uniref:flavin-containing monooxygenase n=1 Tax=Microtetraspora sp. NBRC 16547 TaxID=3030993 RepID=UPI0024A148A9|nr:NAD(P)/FAD-dependent oxidoreductase [Microtetraspora sp. NBRC 16547]GLW99390.1 monooxygenase [Microtetraspora sp. NBRC 16547]
MTTEPRLLPTAGEVRARLGSAETPALLMLVAHVTGDTEVLRPEWRPQPEALPLSGLGETLDAEIRDYCLSRLESYLDSGEAWTSLPPAGVLEKIGKWSLGSGVETPVALLEAAFVADGTDPRRPDWSVEELSPGHQVRAVVVGAGISGLLVGLRLKQAGVDFTIVEKSGEVGGTWWENTYPDCRTDVHSHIYTYSFFPEDWPSYFGRQHVIHGYLRRFAEENGLLEHIEFDTEVTDMTWDEDLQVWRVSTRRTGASETSVRETNVVVSAVGQLNRPMVPEIEGMSGFDGPVFHSAEWDHTVDFAGKRVAVIGTGASVLQIGPALAKTAEHVTIFQRSAPWLMPTPELRQDIGEDERWLLRSLPLYRAYYRLSLFLPRAIGQLDAATVDPDYPPTEHAVSAANEALRVQLTAYLTDQAGGDEELFAKILPDYPPGAKRIIRDDGTWVATLRRDNVDLITDRVARFDAKGVWTAPGDYHPVDAVVFGTGFRASDFLTPMTVTGRGGKDLHTEWGIDACAYMGLTIPDFPNLFCLYGPNTNLVLHGNLVFFLECQAAYVADSVRLLLETGRSAMSLRRDVFDDYCAEVTKASALRVWGWSKTHSWYQNAEGRSTIMWPLPAQRYLEGTAAVDAAHYELT